MDTENLDDTKAIIEPPTADKARAPRSVITLDVKEATLTIDGVTYDATALPENSRWWCTLRGLASRLNATDNPAGAWTDLKAGHIPSHGPAKPKELDPWRRAYAHALADKQAKADGIKPKSVEFAALLNQYMTTAAVIDRSGLLLAKLIPAVVVHYNRLTGNEATL